MLWSLYFDWIGVQILEHIRVQTAKNQIQSSKYKDQGPKTQVKEVGSKLLNAETEYQVGL